MTIIINGEPRTLDGPCTLLELLRRLPAGGGPVAIEVNQLLVPKRLHGQHQINDGDRIEVVTLVGGG